MSRVHTPDEMKLLANRMMSCAEYFFDHYKTAYAHIGEEAFNKEMDEGLCNLVNGAAFLREYARRIEERGKDIKCE